MKKTNITSNAFSGVRMELNVLELVELKYFVALCINAKLKYSLRQEWEEKYYALSTQKERDAFKKEFPKPEMDWGITEYREHLFQAITLLSKFVNNIPDISCKSIFDEKEDPEEILEQPVAHFE